MLTKGEKGTQTYAAQVLPSYGKQFNTQERVRNCCQALLSELDFENRTKPWAARIARVQFGFEVRGKVYGQ